MISVLMAAGMAMAMLTAPAQAEDGARIGYVDLRKVMLESKAGKRNQAALEKMVKEKEAQLAKEEQALRAMQEEFEKNKLVLTDQQKRDKQREFQEKVQAFQKHRTEAQQELGRKDNEFTRKAVDEIRAVLAEIAKEQKLMMVFDVNAQPLYSESGPDLTAKAIEKYDAKNK